MLKFIEEAGLSFNGNSGLSVSRRREFNYQIVTISITEEAGQFNLNILFIFRKI